MAPRTSNGQLKDQSTEPSEVTRKADLRKMMSQAPLPNLAVISSDPAFLETVKPTREALAVLDTFNAALTGEDARQLANCFFAEQAYWKDQLAMTYHLRTFNTPEVIAASLLETKSLRNLSEGLKLKGDARFMPATPTLCFIDCDLTFRTYSPAAMCSGRMLLLPVRTNNHDNIEIIAWKIWILGTKLEDLSLYPEDSTLLSEPAISMDSLQASFEIDVFIVGVGNAAVSLAARLKSLGVNSILMERNARVGDNWNLRYDSLRFHVPTSFCELPYMRYRDDLQSPHLLTKDDLAEQLRCYVSAYNLNVITSAIITGTKQMSDKKWCIQFNTPTGARTAVARHLVQATGFGSQRPFVPLMANEKLYQGLSLHSTQYKSAVKLKDEGVKSVLVVGTANTAFDVIEDCHAAGLQTTLVARSPTYIIPIEYVCHELSLGAYDSDVDTADRNFLTLPTVVDSQLARNLFASLASQEPDRYSALAQAGFPVIDSRHVDVALMHNLIERGGGHYVDLGGTALLAEGKVGLKASVEPVSYTATGLQFSDGSSVDCDTVIWCTGFSDKNVRDTFTSVCKTELPVDATWGVDQEGEIRGMWKRHLHVDNYWVMGGYTQQHRWHSRTLALQIKAALEGVLPPAYRKTPQPKLAEKVRGSAATDICD